jgi:hypothetical protein
MMINSAGLVVEHLKKSGSWDDTVFILMTQSTASEEGYHRRPSQVI